jgi:hypothetical protein
MDIDRDSQGHEHIHATLRDHSGVPRKVIDVQGIPSARGSPALGYGPTQVSKKSKVPKTTVIEEEEEIMIPDLMATPSTVVSETREARKERQKQEKKVKRAMEKAAEKLAKERANEPAFRRLAAEFPAPRSERYAAAPNLEDIEKRARDRYEKRINGNGPSAPGLSANPNIGYVFYRYDAKKLIK